MKLSNDFSHQGKTFNISAPHHPAFLFELLDPLCRGILRSLQDSDTHSDATNEEAFPTRATEAMYPIAILFSITDEPELLAAAKKLGKLLISRQKSAGYWIENSKTQWHGCTIFLLLAISATYKLIEDRLDQRETEKWRGMIRRAADWVKAYSPVSHLNHTFGMLGDRLPGFRNSAEERLHRRRINTNYIATIPAALCYACQALGDETYLDRNNYFIKIVMDQATPDNLIRGENMEVAPKLFKLFRRNDSIDLGYNLDMTLGMLAIYSEMVGDNELLRWVKQHADAHLAFFYPDGSVDNGVGIRGYKSAYFGSETAHGLQMLCSILRRYDAKYDRVSKLNAALIAASLEGGVLQRGPFKRASFRSSGSLYQTFTRATNIALAISHYCLASPLNDTKLLSEEDDKDFYFKSLNSLVVKKSAFMATITGTKLHSSRLPYRFMTPPTGGSMSALYHTDYGPIQLCSPLYYQQSESDYMPTKAERESITARIELLGTGYTNQHDTHLQLTTQSGSIVCNGHLTRRLTLLRQNPYQITYEFKGNSLIKTIKVMKVREGDSVRLVEPIVLTDEVISYELDGGVFTVTTNSCSITVAVDAGNLESKIGLNPMINCYAPPVRAIPVEILLSGKGTISATICINIERIIQ